MICNALLSGLVVNAHIDMPLHLNHTGTLDSYRSRSVHRGIRVTGSALCPVLAAITRRGVRLNVLRAMATRTPVLTPPDAMRARKTPKDRFVGKKGSTKQTTITFLWCAS